MTVYTTVDKQYSVSAFDSFDALWNARQWDGYQLDRYSPQAVTAKTLSQAIRDHGEVFIYLTEARSNGEWALLVKGH